MLESCGISISMTYLKTIGENLYLLELIRRMTLKDVSKYVELMGKSLQPIPDNIYKEDKADTEHESSFRSMVLSYAAWILQNISRTSIRYFMNMDTRILRIGYVSSTPSDVS